MSLVGLGVGAAAALAAIAFVDALVWLNDALLVSAYARVQYEGQALLLGAATLLVPAFGGLLVGLIVTRLIAEKRGLGPPDAILVAQTRQPAPSLKSGLASTLAALLSLGCGASVGQYGPLVYLGTLIGGLVGGLERHVRDLRAIAIACGVAAAIATAFNAPIAGLVFAHEVILRHYSLRAFAPVAVAAATGHVMANVVFERPALFLVEFGGVAHGHEFVLFAVQGVLSAFLAAGFMALILAAGRLAGRLPLPAALRPALAGLVLGAVALQVPEVLGIGKETLRFATIDGAFTMPELALLVAAKIAVTALCVGFGFVGGVFSPALLIGILAGALFGLGVAEFVPVAQSGMVPYAICGMMAMTSPVIGAPLTTILIVFELTRNYDLTIAAMVAVVFSNLVAYRVFGRSLFDVQLRNRRFDLSFGRDKAILGHRPVQAYMTDDFVALAPDDTVDALRRRLKAVGRAEAVLVDATGRYGGLVALHAAMDQPGETPLSTLARTGGVVFDEETTLWEAMTRMRDFIGEAVPLVGADGRLLGVVPEGAVIGGYMEAVHDLRREENAAA
ncbi:MAG: CBS domain-containing protein [Alphaproteobacteria bacterium]|nr:CBS domain-containing protein [Alphaproteobacteria bacterium]